MFDIMPLTPDLICPCLLTARTDLSWSEQVRLA